MRDDNATAIIRCVSSVDGVTIVDARSDPVTGALLADITSSPHVDLNSKVLIDDNGNRAMVAMSNGNIVPFLADSAGNILVDIQYV